MISSPITSWQIDGETMETVKDYLFWGAPISLQMVNAAMKLKYTCSLEKVMTNLDSILKNSHYFANRGPSSQSYGFSSSHVWM